jgi:hypothetical protein
MYIVDLDLDKQAEEHYARHPDWLVTYEESFLSAVTAASWTRSFFIPVVSPQVRVLLDVRSD